MTIQYASDLHLEFPQNLELLKTYPLQPKADFLILAGDVVPFAQLDKHKDFFRYLSDHFHTTWWVPGNHEYYHYDLRKKCGTFNETIRSNIHLVNNLTVQKNNCRLIFSTLWSRINSANAWYIEQSMSDFQAIRYGKYRFTPDRFNELFKDSLEFITSELRTESTGKTVVVTHHVPTLINYPDQYKVSLLNNAFAVELRDLIETVGPAFWIYGHHHQNTQEFSIGKTRMLTNQMGYVSQGEHLLFDHGKVIQCN